jgi:hypothetical protein
MSEETNNSSYVSLNLPDNSEQINPNQLGGLNFLPSNYDLDNSKSSDEGNSNRHATNLGYFDDQIGNSFYFLCNE